MMPSFGADEQTLALQVCPKPEGHASCIHAVRGKLTC